MKRARHKSRYEALLTNEISGAALDPNDVLEEPCTCGEPSDDLNRHRAHCRRSEEWHRYIGLCAMVATDSKWLSEQIGKRIGVNPCQP